MNEGRTVAAFVRENELWTYHVNQGRLTRVFGFPQQQNMDYRDFFDRNNIKVLRVEDTGDLWFAVSGYMNRGSREGGKTGLQSIITKRRRPPWKRSCFIRTMEAYDSLKLDVDTLTYITEIMMHAIFFWKALFTALTSRRENMKR